MNVLKRDKKEMVLSLLVEGNSIRSIERITGVHRDTIMRLLVSIGSKAQILLDRTMVNLNCKNVQVDEIWCFVKKKQKRVTVQEKRMGEVGDQYLFVALDADSKIVPAFHIGKRTSKDCYRFIYDLAKRIKNRYQLSSDAFRAYIDVVEQIYGCDIDYGQIHKVYNDTTKQEKRYSPAKIIEVVVKKLLGNPVLKKISTSYVERQNLTLRMQMRRFTRLTNAFSKKLDNLKCAVALHFYHYNFMRIHQSLRVTPAMESGITNRIWGWNELLSQ